ncbi:MAG TPA: carboxylate--amine ligase, partial [Actinomycetales bacterium]|nr:carboxylate--amine ligase [Actinomycetales bacterium]
KLLAELAPTARRLGCEEELAGLQTTLRVGASYQRQRAVARRNNGNLRAVVEHLVEEMRTGQPQ